MACVHSEPPVGSMIRYTNGYVGIRVRVTAGWWENPDDAEECRDHQSMMEMIRDRNAIVVRWGQDGV